MAIFKYIISICEDMEDSELPYIIEGNEKWPYISVIQMRNTTENELGRTQ